MADPVDRHFQMVEEAASIDRMRKGLECLARIEAPYVVEGGWAVAAHGSPVPSVDLDILIPGGLDDRIAQAIEEATGYQIFAHATDEILSIEVADMDQPNALINRPQRSYIPAAFLAGNTEVRAIDAASGMRAAVPVASHLTFMKLKAFHDRLLQWRAARGERYLVAGMPENERERTIRLGEDHWLRKAGKDLFDASYLCSRGTSIRNVAQVAPRDVWPDVFAALRDIPLPVVAFAEAMARRAGARSIDILAAPTDK